MAYFAVLPKVLCCNHTPKTREVLRQNLIRDFIKDLLKYVPTQVVPAIIGFIAIPIITRLFLPADYGIYVLAIATVSILATVVGWLGMSIIRFYPACERDGKLGELYNSVIKLLFLSIVAVAIAFLVILLLLKPYISSQLYHLMLIGTLLFTLNASYSTLHNFLRARRQLGWYTGLSVWYTVASLGIGIALVIGFHFNVEGLLWGNILSLAVVFPLLWKVVTSHIPLRAKTMSAGLTREMAKYGFPLVVGSLAAWMLGISDRYVLELFRGAHEVGIYSASYAISQNSLLLVTSLFALAAGPIGMTIWEKEGIAKSQEFLNKLTRYYLIICLPAAVGISVLAKPAIGVLTAAEYHEGYRIVALVAFGGFLLGLQQRFQAGLVFHKKTFLIMITIVVSGLLNLGLNFLLIPKYGYMAAAVTSLISYAFMLAIMIFASRRYFVWNFPFKTLGKVACASAIMGVIVYPVGNSLTSSTLANLFAGISIGILVYFLMLLLLREPHKEEIQELHSLTQRIFGGILRWPKSRK